MFKKSLLVFLSLVIIIIIAGCKGNRTVKVTVAHQGIWYAQIKADSGLTTKTGYYTETYDLGNDNTNIVVEAWRITTTADTTKDLSIKIIEQYDNGFLYTASSTVKASITNTFYLPPWEVDFPADTTVAHTYELSNPLAIATVTYDFTPK